MPEDAWTGATKPDDGVPELKGAAIERPWADPTKPHWIVRRMSKYGASEFKPHQPFRHATQEAANTEAQRLATLFPGKRFSVYGSAASFKVEKASRAPAGP